MYFQIVRFFIRLMVHSVAKLEIRGYENLPAGNFMLAANHLGRLDSAILLVGFDRSDFIIPIAEKYKNHPIFGPLGRSVNAIWLNRFEADFSALRQILERMKRGGLMVIAPEGTRSPTGALQAGKPGAAFLALKSGYPILPVALTGTQDRLVLENLRHLRRTVITATAGQPFTLTSLPGESREQTLQRGTDEIMCRIAALLPPEYRGVYAEHPRLKERPHA